MTTATTVGGSDPGDDGYNAFLAALRGRFEAATAGNPDGPPPLFTTGAEGLWDLFLGALPAERRQHYDCRACRRFVERYGGLVLLSPGGEAAPLFWDPRALPPLFAEPVALVGRAVARATVDGVFLSDEATWGVPTSRVKATGAEWHHMAVVPRGALVFRPPATRTVGQAAAEKREEYSMLRRGLEEFPADVVRQALALLTTGALERSEKCVGVARWLLALHEARAGRRGPAADHVVWRAVATAPAGYCHVRSSMIGTLLEDVAAGVPFEALKRRFDEKMHPLQYMRPTAAPSAGNIAQAESLVAKLASAGALARRFARLEDLETLWRPPPPAPEAPARGGVFGHLAPAGKAPAPPVEQPPVTMTWEKFARTVLPEAERLEFLTPAGRASFAAFVTAADPAAPPLLQWDREDRRNPVSHYLYVGGSTAADWNLPAGAWRAVTAVSLQPAHWHGGGMERHGRGVMFVLEGARDLLHKAGGGLFPEDLRGEYHGVRKTMEAHAKQAAIAGRDEATACGILLQQGTGTWAHGTVRVTAKGTRITYRLDRWD